MVKAKTNGNGHTKTADKAMEKTIEEVTKAPSARPLMPSSVEGALRHTQSTGAIDYYLTPGKDINEFGLRAEISDTNTEGVVKGTCLAWGASLAKHYHSELVADFILTSLHLWPARNGHRIDQATQAITGIADSGLGKQKGGISNWVKNKAFNRKEPQEGQQ